MAWWGKLIGGTLGFMMGGPLGALLGGSLGHQFDANRRGGGVRALPGGQERIQLAFFTATFSVMGHIAKADGQVSQQEIQMAKSLMDQMRLDKQQREAAIDLFEQGKHADFPLNDVLHQFRKECQRRTTVLRMFIEIQVQAAMADGRLDPQENLILLHAADVLGFDQSEVENLINLVSGTAGHVGRQPARSIEQAYKILGASKNDSDVDIKKSYRRLMNQHHPDKLVAKGVPEEMVKLATEKTQEIRSAWEQVRDDRRKAA